MGAAKSDGCAHPLHAEEWPPRQKPLAGARKTWQDFPGCMQLGLASGATSELEDCANSLNLSQVTVLDHSRSPLLDYFTPQPYANLVCSCEALPYLDLS